MEKIKILSDSTCDLTPEQVAALGIEVIPVNIILGVDTYLDGEITPTELLEYCKKTGELPKTAATNSERYKEYFSKYLNEGYTLIFPQRRRLCITTRVPQQKNLAAIFSLLIQNLCCPVRA